MFGFLKKLFGAVDENNNGSIVDDVTQHVVKVAKKITKTKKELEALTKKQLEEHGRNLGIELDRRLTKAKLVVQLQKEQRRIKKEMKNKD